MKTMSDDSVAESTNSRTQTKTQEISLAANSHQRDFSSSEGADEPPSCRKWAR
jgi:hypothetical protein